MQRSFQRFDSSSARQVSLYAATIGAAASGVGDAFAELASMRELFVVANFGYGAGGTTAKFWVQTSLDAGSTWMDVMSFAFTTSALKKVSGVRVGIALAGGVTPTDGTLADNTILDGVLGDRLRVKYATVGTYTGATTIAIGAVIK